MDPKTPTQQEEARIAAAIYGRIYDLFLTEPLEGRVPEEGDDPVETDVERAIKSDRFQLMYRVRELRDAAQRELDLQPTTDLQLRMRTSVLCDAAQALADGIYEGDENEVRMSAKASTVLDAVASVRAVLGGGV